MGLYTLGWWPIAMALVSGLGLLLALGTGCQTRSKHHRHPNATYLDRTELFEKESEFVLSEETQKYEREHLNLENISQDAKR
jgi:hypothetical protein